MTAAEAEATVTDEMSEVKARTTADGTVEGTVKRIEKTADTPHRDGQYHVVVEVPYGDDVDRFFDIPAAWTHDYAFVRWVEHYGYTAENIARLAADDAAVQVSVEDGRRRLVVPDPPEPRFHIPYDDEKMKEIVADALIWGSWIATTAVGAGLAVVYGNNPATNWVADALLGGLAGLLSGLFVAMALGGIFICWLGWTQ